MSKFPLYFCLLLSACNSSSNPSLTGTPHDESTPPEVSNPPPVPTLPPIASLSDGVWMKGDLHIHSEHSNDSTNNPVAKILALADSVGMDYLAITDHDNHVLGDVANHTWADPDYQSDHMVLLYGAEWTTHRGHGNTFSARRYDHQRFYDVRDARDTVIAQTAKELGFHLSANHPGGSDNFGFSYDMANSVEVWNSAIWMNNANAQQIWDDMLKSGRKLTGRGGSDSHHGYPDSPDAIAQNSIQAGANNVGTPTTWLFATERSGDAVVQALSNGRVSVSSNPYAPRVELLADLDQDGRMDMMMGDVAAATGSPVTFQVKMVGGTLPALLPYTVTVIKDGAEWLSLQIAPPATSAEFTDTPAAQGRSYYRVLVEGQQAAYPEIPGAAALSANMVALSNPIYFNFDPAF